MPRFQPHNWTDFYLLIWCTQKQMKKKPESCHNLNQNSKSAIVFPRSWSWVNINEAIRSSQQMADPSKWRTVLYLMRKRKNLVGTLGDISYRSMSAPWEMIRATHTLITDQCNIYTNHISYNGGTTMTSSKQQYKSAHVLCVAVRLTYEPSPAYPRIDSCTVSGGFTII